MLIDQLVTQIRKKWEEGTKMQMNTYVDSYGQIFQKINNGHELEMYQKCQSIIKREIEDEFRSIDYGLIQFNQTIRRVGELMLLMDAQFKGLNQYLGYSVIQIGYELVKKQIKGKIETIVDKIVEMIQMIREQKYKDDGQIDTMKQTVMNVRMVYQQEVNSITVQEQYRMDYNHQIVYDQLLYEKEVESKLKSTNVQVLNEFIHQNNSGIVEMMGTMELVYQKEGELYQNVFGENAMDQFRKQMVDEQGNVLIEQYLIESVNRREMEKVKQIYQLVNEVEVNRNRMGMKLQEYIKNKIGRMQGNMMEMIDQILNLKREMQKMNEDCFNNDIQIHQCQQKGIQWGFKNDERLVYALAGYFDQNQRVEHKMDDLIDLFRQLPDKDMFLLKYQFYLGRRLIMEEKLDDRLIQKLGQECGSYRVRQIFKMKQDMNEQWSIQESAIEFKVRILTDGYWPRQLVDGNVGLSYPYKMKQMVGQITHQYQQRHSHRKLRMLELLGKVEITYIQLGCSLVLTEKQAIVLLLFNSADCLSITEIQQASRLQDVQTIIDPLVKIGLIKNNDCMVSISESYNQKGTVDLTRKQKQKEMNKQDGIKVFQQREKIVDSIVVAYLKRNRSAEFKSLFDQVQMETQKQGFNIEMNMMKTRIEWLIQQEYIQRHDESPSQLVYIP